MFARIVLHPTPARADASTDAALAGNDVVDAHCAELDSGMVEVAVEARRAVADLSPQMSALVS